MRHIFKTITQRVLAFLFFSDLLVFNRPFRNYLSGMITLPDNRWIVKFVEQYHYLWRFIQVQAKAKNLKNYTVISQQEWEGCWATLYNYYTESGQFDAKPGHQFMVDFTAEAIDDEVESVLEVGCGNARVMKKLNERCQGRWFVGMDLSAKMLEFGKHHMELPANIRLVRGSVLELPLNQKFDLVFCPAVLQYMDETQIVPVLDQLLRLTTKRLVLIGPFKDKKHIKDEHTEYLEGPNYYVHNYLSILRNMGVHAIDYRYTVSDWVGVRVEV